VGRGGLVRDPAVHVDVVMRVAAFFDALGFGAVDVARPAITGRKSGNREYPLRLVRDATVRLNEGRVREVAEGG
jgi:23S rRNA (cytidine1920-2'-O)/16S rRNA (cytidine1409-2'-O)-methyltransferase